ncbi:hypothetical protein LPJ60_006456, partial [Coemansia sp. RSA 2675]
MRVSSSVLALFLASFAAASPLIVRGGHDSDRYDIGNYGGDDYGFGGGNGGHGGHGGNG